jgi:alpha,alpha-trehalose phosphorylase
VFGFGGVRDFDETLSITPRLPAAWRSLTFSLRFRDRQLRIELGHRVERYAIDAGDPLSVTIRGEPHALSVGRPIVLQAAADGRRERAA